DGYGVEAALDAAACSTDAVHNTHRSLVPLLADALNAEDFAPCASGTGVMFSEAGTASPLFAMTYPRAFARADAPAWDFPSWQPDLIVVMVGGTDVANPLVNPPPTLENYQAAFGAFVDMVRRHNPAAHILVTVSPTITDDWPGLDVN